MKLSSSTGDFSFYVKTVSEKVRCFKDTKFRYINLEQCGEIPELFSDADEDWKKFAQECKDAADYAEVTYVISHAPCLHFAIPEALVDSHNVQYRKNVRAIRRSIEVCHALNIPRIVIHACVDPEFDEETFYRYNKMFYEEFFDLAEKYNVMILTENWDNDASLFSTGEKMRKFLDYINHPLLCACWDTAHGNIAKGAREIGQYENIIALGDKLKGLHISDNFGDVHHHSWPFAGIINFDQVMQGLIDVGFDWYFNFEASYTLLHHRNMPYNRKNWEHEGRTVEKLLDPPIHIKQKAVDLLYDVGEHILKTYGVFEK
jgi:sugar phosphate isomerase/epimerase